VKKVDRVSGITPAAFAVLPPFTAALALDLAPVRVNLIQAGFVDTALAASSFKRPDDLEARREELRTTLPIERVVGPADLAALALQLMVNTAITGAAYDIDGGQSLIAATTAAPGKDPRERPPPAHGRARTPRKPTSRYSFVPGPDADRRRNSLGRAGQARRELDGWSRPGRRRAEPRMIDRRSGGCGRGLVVPMEL
jgi:enoyl-ACP reductase-like protein